MLWKNSVLRGHRPQLPFGADAVSRSSQRLWLLSSISVCRAFFHNFAVKDHCDKSNNELPWGNVKVGWWPKYQWKPQAKAKHIRKIVFIIEVVRQMFHVIRTQNNYLLTD